MQQALIEGFVKMLSLRRGGQASLERWEIVALVAFDGVDNRQSILA
jgi:hypothetical protein